VGDRLSSHSFAEDPASGLKGLPLQPVAEDEAPLSSSFAPLSQDAISQPLHRLGELLIDRGVIDRRSLARAERVAIDTGGRLDRTLTQLGIVSERDLAQAMAELFDAPLAGPTNYPSEPLFIDRLRPKFLRKAQALPIAADDTSCTIAVADPFNDFTPRAIEAALGRRVSIVVGVPIELEAALNRLYPEFETEAGEALLEQVAAGGAPSEEDAERLKDLASEAPVIRLVNQLIARAVETRASDVHAEPFEDRLRIRYRYDGVLHEIEPPPARLQAAIISRLKIMSRLDIAERRLPQDGRIRLTVRGHDIDFRVSTVPSLHGESVVLRVLDRTAVEFDYGKLGLPEDVRQGLEHALDLPNGMVLVTGPTGSGKTTTLYTGLLRLNSVVRKIITVEDPIEYQLPGINQIQVRAQIGLNFATLLRSILRQDPDVIMIGEIRDLETAQIAVQAALTGHLVLSTVHTNSAAATVTRLRDMGVEDYLLAATLKGVLAQRLVRRLCPTCKTVDPAAEALIDRFDLRRFSTIPRELLLYRPVGCAECRGTGYRGRRAIAELLSPNPEISRLMFAGADQTAIERTAVAGGLRPIFQAGLLAVIEGDTTIEEVVRCIRSEVSEG
jgi:general secretion pathway protein E